MDRRQLLEEITDRFDLLAIYLFGSRAADGLRLLNGESVEAAGSDLDVGIVPSSRKSDLARLGEIQMALQDIFAPFHPDLVLLERVDPIFQFRAIDGYRVAASDTRRADFFELEVMRQASELLYVQRQLERDLFGVSTT